MKHFFIALVALALLSITACSEDSNPTAPAIYGYSLEQFVPLNDVIAITDYEADADSDFRDLYAYQIIADDGWSPRNSSTAGYDLSWDQLRSGYLVPDDQHKTWFPDPLLPGAFRVKNAHEIRLYRHVRVQHNDGEAYHVQLGALPVEVVENWNAACEMSVRLSDIILGYEGYDSVTLVSEDGYSQSYTPEQIEDGFYHLETEVTTFPTFNDDMSGGQKRFKKIASITIHGGTEVQHEAWGNAAEEEADLTITLPTYLDAYDSTELTDY